MMTRKDFIKTFLSGIISVPTAALFNACETLDERLYAVSAPKCIGCKKCLSVCPQNAIVIVEEKAVIDKQECIGCGRCLRVCSESAIYPIEDDNKH